MTNWWTFTCFASLCFVGTDVLRVTNLSNGAHVARAFSVVGHGSPNEAVDMVAEYLPSKLPGYENYHDVVGSWKTVSDSEGSFHFSVRLAHLPSPAPLVLSVRQGHHAPVRLEIRVDR